MIAREVGGDAIQFERGVAGVTRPTGNSAAIREVLTLIEQVAPHESSVLVLGESGIGKTCVVRALEDALSRVHFRLTYVAHVTLAPRDFYRQLCYALNIEPKATPAAMFEAIQRECVTTASEHRAHAVPVMGDLQRHVAPDSFDAAGGQFVRHVVVRHVGCPCER